MPNNQQGINEKLPEGNQFWFKELGHKVLTKIYEKGTTPGNAKEPGTIAQTFQGIYKESGLQNEELAASLHHQKDTVSFAKTIKGINRFFTSDQNLVNARQDYLTQVASVVWAVKDLTDKQGDFFSRGSIKIKDPSGKLFKFLKGYVQFATGAENPGFLLGANDFAYDRHPDKKLSSHYTKFETEQYGIDMRFTGGKPALEILPNIGDSHLLFGRVKVNNLWYTFIKGEPAGLGNPLEFLEHTRNFLLPQKHHGVARKESQIPKSIKDAYEEYYLNEQFYFEANPKLAGVSGREFDLALESGIPLDIIKWHKKATTIAQMHRQISHHHPKTEKGVKAVSNFNNAVNELGFKKDILIRTGNEVILDLRKISSQSKVNNPPKTYLLRRQVRMQNVHENKNRIDLTVDSKHEEIDHKRKPETQGGSSKRLRK